MLIVKANAMAMRSGFRVGVVLIGVLGMASLVSANPDAEHSLGDDSRWWFSA